MFRIGGRYTRREIHAELGGSIQSYLPHREGRVVAACLRLDTNPDAPNVILPGRGEGIEHAADMLTNQDSPVPTFLKRSGGAWEYVGDYAVSSSSSDPAEIERHAGRSGRVDITRVIQMVKVVPAEEPIEGGSTDDRWEGLVRDLTRSVAVYAPEWTNYPESDPGVTLMELMAFLGEDLLTRSTPTARAVSRLRDVVTVLERAADAPCAELPNPTRPRYFEGRLISAADLAQEQEYHRTRRRRHNLLLHGTGIVSGLDVEVESDASGGQPSVSVSPGLAIGADGEELVVCERMTIPLTTTTSPGYVVLRLADRPFAIVPTPAGDEPSRIEEVVEVDMLSDVLPPDIAIARVVRSDGGWQIDRTFKPSRANA
jgi:hypothetical protein